MAIRTVTLSGAITAVPNLDGSSAHIRNDSADVLYAAKTSAVKAGADGTASIPAGQACTLRGISGAVYLLGTGSVLVQTDDYSESPFKASAPSGGSGADSTARTAISTHAGNSEIHVTAADKAKWNTPLYSNPNLVANPDFRINQRGAAKYTADSASVLFAVDRWRIQNAVSLAVTDSGVTVQPTETTSAALTAALQNIPFSVYDDDIYVTLSFAGDCTDKAYFRIYALGEGFTALKTSSALPANDCSASITLGPVPAGTSMLRVGLSFQQGASVGDKCDLKWVKLEIGKAPTPFTPPEPATELEKCQRFFQIRSTGNISAADLRPSMRTTPAVAQISGGYSYSAEI